MLLGYDKHTELQNYVKTLNAFYKEHPAFWQIDYSWEGFQWIVPDDSQQSVVAFLRKDAAGKQILIVCNFNPVLREATPWAHRCGYLQGSAEQRRRSLRRFGRGPQQGRPHPQEAAARL